MPMPMPMNDLCIKDALELRDLIIDQKVSVLEVIDAHLAAIDARNPAINAVVGE